MAQDVEAPPDQQPPASGIGLWVWGLVSLMAGGIGAALPLLLVSQPVKQPSVNKEVSEIPSIDKTTFVPFGDVTVNLADARMTRYLHLTVTLQVPKLQVEDFNRRLEAKRVVLKNWLLSHISDKDLDDIRGAAGQNRLRREIRDEFNTVLYPEGYDRIYDVLFDEFNVQ